MTTTKHPAAEPVNSTALRLARTPGDMAKAVLVLLVPVAILVALYIFLFNGAKPIVVDAERTFTDARASAPYTVVEPTKLSSGWKPISSAFTPSRPFTLRVGYVTPDGSGIQLVESAQDAGTLVSDELGRTTPVSTNVVAGDRTWVLVKSSDSANRALVDTESGRTLIIMGQASDSELTALASSLR